ncbi:MAG: ChaN family lipoprotein [Bdellovibrionales bacterium]
MLLDIKRVLISFLTVCSLGAQAESVLYRGSNLDVVSLDEVLAQIPKGSVVIVSEQHGHAPHHRNQKALIEGLLGQGHQVDSALEFVQRRFNLEFERYMAGQLTDEQFTQAAEWGKIPFELYKPLIWTPVLSGGRSWGINADRRLTSKVAASGLESLSEKERLELPADFVVGNGEYFGRFREAMKDHASPDEIERYFAAQSIWDDTMAYEIKKIHDLAPHRTLVVIVGDFHNAYGGGLPDRLRARGLNARYTISQVAKGRQTCEQIKEEIKPRPQWGQRADWVWVSP